MASKTYICKMFVESDEPEDVIQYFIKQRLQFQSDNIITVFGVEVSRCFPYDKLTTATAIKCHLKANREVNMAREEGYTQGYNAAMAISSYREAYVKGRSDERRYRREIVGGN